MKGTKHSLLVVALKNCLQELAERSYRSVGEEDQLTAMRACFEEHGFAAPKVLQLGKASHGEFWVPASVFDVVHALLQGRRYDRVFDPFAGKGFLAASVVESGLAQTATLRVRGSSDLEVAQSLAGKLGLAVGQSPLSEMLAVAHGEFDLIISMPPWNVRTSTLIVDTPGGESLRITDDEALLAIAQLRSVMREDCRAIYLLPPSFVFRRGKHRVVDHLGALGLRVESLIYLPTDTFKPWASIRGILVELTIGAQGRVFVAELSADSARMAQVIENYRNRAPGADPGLGRLVDWEMFTGFEALVADERMTALGAKLGWPEVLLAAVATDVRLSRKEPGDDAFEERANAVYIALLGTSEVVSDPRNIKIKPQNVAQVVLDPERADATFVAHFFNTPLGRLARDQRLSGAVIPRLTKSSIPGIPLRLPPLAQQHRYVDAAAKITALATDLRDRADRLWIDPRTLEDTEQVLGELSGRREADWKEWLDRLPFPLASILWAYHAAGEDHKQRYEHLLHFFEAAAEFHVAISVSAARSGLAFDVGEFDRELSGAMRAPGLKKASFGTWTTALGFVGKRFRALLNSGPENLEKVRAAFRIADVDVLALLASSDLASILQNANTRRNEWQGHSGIVSPVEAERRHRALAEILDRIRGVYGTIWDRMQLILPVKAEFRGGVFRYSARRVMGRSAPFEETILETEHPLEDGRLHLVGQGERRALELLPFVVIGASPSAVQNACYFYSRQQPEGLRYVSYHHEQKAEILNSDPATTSLLEALSAR